MTSKPISLKLMFVSINHVTGPVIEADQQAEAVLTYDHAKAIVKRFASDDAAFFHVLGKQTRRLTLAEAYKAVTDPTVPYNSDYTYIYKASKPIPEAESPFITLNKDTRIVLDQGSGYQNTLYLIHLIIMARNCRALLAPRFPLASSLGQLNAADLAHKLDRKQRARFPLFEGEAVALKNLALPTNPMDPELADPEQLRAVYKTEFERLLIRPTTRPEALTRNLIGPKRWAVR